MQNIESLIENLSVENGNQTATEIQKITAPFLIYNLTNLVKEDREVALNNWQREVVVFYSKLQLFLTLNMAGATPQIKIEVLKEIIKYADIFWRKALKKNYAQSRHDWVSELFPNIFNLQNKVSRIRDSQFESIKGKI